MMIGGLRGGGALPMAVIVVLVSCFSASVSASDAASSPPLLAPIEQTLMLAERDDISLRLPNETYPIHYDVHLNTKIDEEIFDFTGQVDIKIFCVAATNQIVLHTRLITISKITLTTGNVERQLTNFDQNEETEFLTIALDGIPLVANQEYTLSITFAGVHALDNVGWYRASYVNDNNDTV